MQSEGITTDADVAAPPAAQEEGFFNENQLLAIRTVDRDVLVLAPAGTGKTVIVQHKFIAFHDLHGPGSVAAITFTRKAGQEIKKRLRKAGVVLDARNPEDDGYLDSTYVGTFHAVGIKVLQDAARLGLYGGPVVMIETTEQNTLAHRAVADANKGAGVGPAATKRVAGDVTELKTVASRIKQMGWFAVKDGYGRPDGTFVKTVTGLPNAGSVAHAKALAYQELLWENAVLDFDDVLIQATAVLEAHRDRVMPRLKALIVDEYQDTNAAQEQMLLAMSRSIHLTCCGDDDQALYSWRGAKIENILSFETRHPGCLIVSLNSNYRSPKAIVSAAELLISHNKARHDKPPSECAVSDSISDGQPITIHDYTSKYPTYNPATDGFDNGLVHYTAQVARDVVQAGTKPSDITVLTRTNQAAKDIHRVLNQMNMPARIANQDAVNSLELRRLTAWLRILTNPADATAASILSYSGDADQAFMDICRAARQQRTTPIEYVVEAHQRGRMKQRRFADLAQAYAMFSDRAMREDPVGLVERICKYEMDRPFASTADSKHTHFWAVYANLVLVMGESPRLRTALDYLMNSAADEDVVEAEEEKIDVSTVHSIKGRQKKVVIISALVDGIMPSSQAVRGGVMGNQMQEERRLAYVALTRASERVHVITVDKARSRFLGEMGAVRPSPKQTAAA